MYICIHTHITHTYICIYTYTHITHTCIYIYIYMYIHVCIYIYIERERFVYINNACVHRMYTQPHVHTPHMCSHMIMMSLVDALECVQYAIPEYND